MNLFKERYFQDKKVKKKKEELENYTPSHRREREREAR
jgi:hypothetical protein